MAAAYGRLQQMFGAPDRVRKRPVPYAGQAGRGFRKLQTPEQRGMTAKTHSR